MEAGAQPTPSGGGQLFGVRPSGQQRLGDRLRQQVQQDPDRAVDGKSWTQVPSPGPAGSVLSGVAAVSAGTAWRWATSAARQTLIEQWNGAKWARVSSPNPAGGSSLIGVAATSATNAWAVGCTSNCAKTLILRWNGTTWK